MVIGLVFYLNSGKRNTKVENEALVNADIIYPGIYIERYSIGGLTKEQAKKRAKEGFDELDSYSVTLGIPYGDYEKTLSFTQLGAQYNIDGAVETGYNMCKGLKEDQIKDLLSDPEYIDPEYICDNEKTKEVLTSLKPEIDKEISKFSLNTMNVEKTLPIIEDLLLKKLNDCVIYVVTE